MFTTPHICLTSANSTMPLSSVFVGIPVGKFVSAYAVCFHRGRCASNIFKMRNGLKMAWVDTRRISTEMIYLKSVLNQSILPFVRETMRIMRFAISRMSKNAIARRQFIGGPQPTGFRFCYLSPKSVFRRFAHHCRSGVFAKFNCRIAMPQESSIVSTAKAPGPYRLVAIFKRTLRDLVAHDVTIYTEARMAQEARFVRA